MTELIWHALMHAVSDTLRLVPFLFLTYLVMEYLEHKTQETTQQMIRRAGKLGPLIGGIAGVFPQCGFSAAASSFYAGGVIPVGTLMAVFLSTSDEMLPIFISEAVEISCDFKDTGSEDTYWSCVRLCSWISSGGQEAGNGKNIMSTNTFTGNIMRKIYMISVNMNTATAKKAVF